MKIGGQQFTASDLFLALIGLIAILGAVTFVVFLMKLILKIMLW